MGKQRKGQAPPAATPIPPFLLLRLDPAHYSDDIRAIRTLIPLVQNGAAALIAIVRITHIYEDDKHIDAFVNLAWRPARGAGQHNFDGSLYVIGWGLNGRPVVKFSDLPRALQGFPPNTIPIGGDYRALMREDHVLPRQSVVLLHSSIQTLRAYLTAIQNPGPNPPITPVQTIPMATLIVACSEAIRFEAVRQGIDSILQEENAQQVFVTPGFIQGGWSDSGYQLGVPIEADADN